MKVWKDIIGLAAAYLQQHEVPDAQTAAELLAARLLKCGRGFIVSHLERPVSGSHLDAMRRAIVRLSGGEPLQYVLGEWDFRTLTLKCDKRALIPRPETEELVERVLKHARGLSASASSASNRPFIVDLGTGSGCIILSLAKELGNGIFLGTDISSDAVSLATENARLCGLEDKVRFAVADGLDEFEPESVDIIVSNPPYISNSEYEALDPRVKDFEPKTALIAGTEGLDYYDTFVGDAMNVLKPGGAIFLEIGEGQGDALRRMLFDYGFGDILIEKDFAGHDRYASAKMQS